MHDPLYKTFRQAFPPFCLMEVHEAPQMDVTRSMRWRRSGMNRLALLMTTGGGPDGEVTLTIDRPFIYIIRDSNTGEILFAGRVLDPGKH
jgi:hypothetical protein